MFAGAQIVTVNAVKAEMGTVHERLLLTGSLKPKEQVDVMPKSTGRVESIKVHVGDTVKVGDLIAELDREELDQQVRRAEAAIQVSRATMLQRKAELANSETMLSRAAQLQKDGLISPQDYEMQQTETEVVRSQLSLAEAQMSQTEADLRELKIRLDQTRILAPINGQIATRHADVGALMGPTNPIVRIVNLQTLVTAANVPERNIGKLRIGNEAIVRVDAFGGREFVGRIARISPVLDAATRSANIEIEISNPGNLLKAEMFARVELDLASRREMVLIPREALVYRGTQSGIYLIRNDRPEFRAIETGISEGGKIEVLSNLEPGTVIVGRGSTMIGESDRIRVTDREILDVPDPATEDQENPAGRASDTSSSQVAQTTVAASADAAP
jgi:RND family efflux transporter MFP subunit